MFRHQGRHRTLIQNLRIASLLSFVAGMVNVVGFLAVQKLTTNVTGHFAFFVDEIFKLDFNAGMHYFLYILFFFLGSFFSNFLIELITRRNDRLTFSLPVIIESLILLSVALFGNFIIKDSPNLLAYSLLFAMGMQNSLVTTISNATVRTTHLTGLFTDLGIELSQLLFYPEKDKQIKLRSSIRLRFTIICFFFFGGIVGGIGYTNFGIAILALATILLILGLLYDYLRITLVRQLK